MASALRRVVGGMSVRLTASIGVARIDAGTSSDEAVLTEADRAMYQEKYRQPPIG